MTFARVYKKVIIFLGALFLLLSNVICVHAVSNNDETPLIPKKLEKEANSSNIKINSIMDNSKYIIDVSISTKGLEKGYYTPCIYENIEMDWSKYTMVAFHVENNSESELRLNLIVQEKDGARFLVSDDKTVMVKGENSKLMQRLHPSYGVIEFHKGFKGTVYIPFSSLGKQGWESNSEKFNISSWGIIIASSENEEKKFKLSEFLLINDLGKISKDIDVRFLGDTQVQIPVVGESIAKYKVEIYSSNGKPQDKNVKIKLVNHIEGVRISEDGKLTITEAVNPQKIKVCAIIDDTVSEVKEVQLFKSWTLSATEIDGTSKSVPKPIEVKNIVGEGYNFLLDKEVVRAVRVIFVIWGIAWGGLFVKWTNKAKKICEED